MGYEYKNFKRFTFSNKGQILFLKVRDKIKKLFKKAGAVTMGAVIDNVSGDAWNTMACVDRLLELKEIREIKQSGDIVGQDRIFVSNK